MNKIIYCKDCKYCDAGLDEKGIQFYKCLANYNYGGTSLNDFCSHAEYSKSFLRKILNELHSAAAYGRAFNIKQVPIQTDIVINIIELLEDKDDSKTIN